MRPSQSSFSDAPKNESGGQDPATEKQVEYIAGLDRERSVPGLLHSRVKKFLNNSKRTKQEASALIKELLDCERIENYGNNNKSDFDLDDWDDDSFYKHV